MALNVNSLQWRLCIVVFLAVLVQQAQGQDYFAPLKDLDKPAPRGVSNQNFTRCCLRALKDWRDNPKNSDIIVQSSKNPFNIFTTVDDLGKTDEQFPCGAEYDDKTNNKEGATRVKISYTWCKSNCGGWQRSRSSVLEQWVQPFVGFILPAAVFCLNVPRKKVIGIPDVLFMDLTLVLTMKWKYFTEKAKGNSAVGMLPDFVTFVFESASVILRFLFGALLAATIGLFNVVAWVVVVFSTAAPMILSGLYEATIDRQVLRAIEKDVLKSQGQSQEGETKNDPKRVKYQIHFLYAVLVGNLKLRKSPKDQGTEDPDGHLGRAWADVDRLIDDLDPAHPEKAKNYEKEKTKTGARLKTMLACQASFGASVGAPVAFFLGSFLFSIFSNHPKLGDSDVSLSLAFGEWWMTIPHVAIVSGCLLAGNNPNTLEAIVSGIDKIISPKSNSSPTSNEPSTSNNPPTKSDPATSNNPPTNSDPATSNNPSTNNGPLAKNDPSTEKKKAKHQDGVLAPFYASVYQPVWMWERGRNKENWLKEVKRKYPAMRTTDTESKNPEPKSPESKDLESKDLESKGPDPKGADSKVEALHNAPESKHVLLRRFQKLWRDHLTTPHIRDVPKVGGFQWIFLLLTASTLIVIPFVLAYVTSFYTPTIGLSCRTFTFVLYFVFQSLLTMVWLYDFVVKDHSGAKKSIFVYFLAWLFFTGSCFTAIIGTFMQIVGVYRNCLCNIPMGYWGSRDFHFTVSTNSAEGIHYAGLYWLSTGIASICLLVVFCYFGWWYQRHWRSRFDDVVDNILDVKPVIKAPTKPGEERGLRRKLDALRTHKPGKNGSTSNLRNNASATNLGKDGNTTTPEKGKTTNGSEPARTKPEPAQNSQQPAQNNQQPAQNNQQPAQNNQQPVQNSPQSGQNTTATTTGQQGKDDDAIEKVDETTK